jgi:hypothetical protein
VRMYSTPSGHAVAINTSDPNNTATPSEISKRDNPSGPPEPVPGVVELPDDELVVGAVVDPVAGTEPAPGVVTADASVATVSLAIVNRKLELPPLCASGWLTCHETTHSPFGSGFGTVTLSDTPSSPIAGLPTAIGDPLQATWTVLVAPSGLANVSSSDGGDVSTVLPAVGEDDTIVLSAAAARGTANPPTAVTPAKTTRARRRARADGEVLFMQVAQR